MLLLAECRRGGTGAAHGWVTPPAPGSVRWVLAHLPATECHQLWFPNGESEAEIKWLGQRPGKYMAELPVSSCSGVRGKPLCKPRTICVFHPLPSVLSGSAETRTPQLSSLASQGYSCHSPTYIKHKTWAQILLGCTLLVIQEAAWKELGRDSRNPDWKFTSPQVGCLIFVFSSHLVTEITRLLTKHSVLKQLRALGISILLASRIHFCEDWAKTGKEAEMDIAQRLWVLLLFY